MNDGPNESTREPIVQGSTHRLMFEQHEHSWDLIMVDKNGTAGLAATGPTGSAHIIQHLVQAAGGVRRDNPRAGAQLDMPQGGGLVLPGHPSLGQN